MTKSPSKEQILVLLKQLPFPPRLDQLADALGITRDRNGKFSGENYRTVAMISTQLQVLKRAGRARVIKQRGFHPVWTWK